MRTTLLTFGGILILILVLLFGMRSFTGGNQDQHPNDPGQVTPPPAQARTLPAPPENLLNTIFDQADFIDYIFYNLNFSMSIEEPESVKGSVAYMSLAPVPDLDCTPSIGKIFYKSKGVTIQEADLHFTQNCSYIVLLNEQRQQAYACKISENGIKNLSNMLGNVRTNPQ